MFARNPYVARFILRISQYELAQAFPYAVGRDVPESPYRTVGLVGNHVYVVQQNYPVPLQQVYERLFVQLHYAGILDGVHGYRRIRHAAEKVVADKDIRGCNRFGNPHFLKIAEILGADRP